MRFIFFFILINCLTSSLISQNTLFLQHNIVNGFYLAAGIDVGDLDLDGFVDVVGGSGANSGNTVIWNKNLGTAPLTWETFVIDNNINGVLSTQIADLNGDGHPDIIAAAWESAQIAAYYSSGTNPLTWQKQIIETGFLLAHEVYADDLNNDGNIDLIAAAAVSNEISVWLNQGGNPIVWQKTVLSQNYAGARSVFSADLNNDGVKEVVGAGFDNNKISYWKQIDFEPYWEEVVVTDDFIGAHRVRTYDIDNDGHLDILGEAYTSGKVAWWKNLGTEPLTFQKYTIDDDFELSQDVIAADFNADNLLEVVSTSENTATMAIYYQTPTNPGLWTKEIISNTYTNPWRLETCDLDADQDIDIISGAYQSGTIDYWENLLYSCYFFADRTSGHAPLTINFSCIDNSPVPYTNFAWDFDNDYVIDSNLQNPSFTFTEIGIYPVTLTVSNDIESKTITLDDYITVFNGETALSFTNSQALAASESSPELNLTQALTLEAWIFPTGWGVNSTHGFGRIIDKQKFSLYLKKESNILNNNCLVFQFTNLNNATFYCFTPDNSLQLNIWQHVAISYDGNSLLKMYINGIEQNVEFSTNPPNGAIADNTNNDLLIGAGITNSNNFQGVIDEIRIWNSVRSLEQLTDFMSEIIPQPLPEMIAYYQFNDAWGNLAQDNSNQNHPLTLTSTIWVQGANLTHPQSIDENQPPSPSLEIIAYPNPFNPAVNLMLNIKKHDLYKLSIYNAKGQLVKNIFNQILSPGKYEFSWNGSSQSKNTSPSGIYFCRLSSTSQTTTRKILLLK